MQEFYLYADSTRGRIKANAVAFIDRLPANKPFVLAIKPLKRERTSSQNAGLFAAGYPPLMEFCGYQGDADKRELHREFCGAFFGWVDTPTGGSRPARTTTTNERGQRDVVPWDVFCEFYAFVQRKGAELGVFIPDPDPLWREVKRETRHEA
jgi:hypothetical protein